jgi:hypothetical protein
MPLHVFCAPTVTCLVASIASNLGLKLLGVWLILYGLFDLFELSFRYDSLLMAILALVAGILIIIDS